MNEVLHIETMVSNAWSGWVLLALLVLAVLSEAFQPGVVSGASVSLLASTNRNYKPAPDNFLGQTGVALFRIGTLALALCVWAGDEAARSFPAYTIALALTAGLAVAKMLCNAVLNYTYSLRLHADGIDAHYGNLVTLWCIGLYPALLVLRMVDNLPCSRWVIGILAALFLIAAAYKAMSVYATSLRAVVYIILYILTLEVLPVAALVVIGSQMIRNL